ncbi:MAG: hypothetical protein HFE73_02695 [Firmicutes bacterium]|nr:hypothetical protein [Bacillota bacterium]
MGSRYFPEAGNSWLHGIEESQYMMGAYGKGEKVKFYGADYFPKAKGEAKVYTDFFGQKAYLEDKVVYSLSDFTYETKPIFKTIVLKNKIDVYRQPRYMTGRRVYAGEELYVVAQTSDWYKVILGGKAGFISKKDAAIKKVKSAKFPKIDVSKMAKKERNNVRKRVRYQFAVLPEKIRDMILNMKLKVIVTPEFDLREGKIELESYHKGSCIYLKENKNVQLETNILLEIGELFLEQEIEKEDKNLASAIIAAVTNRDSLRHMKGGFQMFVRMPERQQELIPYMYYLFYDIID